METRKYFTDVELRTWVQASNFWGFVAVLTDWGIISFSFFIAAKWPNIFTIVLAMALLGGRQLALAILVHDCAHYSLFRTRWLNQWVGKWLCGVPVWQSLNRYRQHHLKHHRLAGTIEDPDYSLVAPFPIRWSSFARKLVRDLSGISGFKRIYGLFLMDLSFITYTAAADPKPIPREDRPADWFRMGLIRIAPVMGWQILLLTVFAWVGNVWLYWLWLGGYFIFFSLFVRIRSIAEHACTTLDLDPRLNTRTTQANYIARLTVAPHRVNYHLEHHLLMTVPHHKFPKLHQVFLEKNALNSQCVEKNYLAVLRRAITM